MFGVDTSELLVVAILALLFIGPKELPTVMLRLGRMIGKVRGYARHFTSGIEEAIRQAEIEEMDRKWREQNERILAAHPADAVYPEPGPVMTALPPPGEGEMPGAAHDPDQPPLPLEAPAAPDDDPRPPRERPLP
ncbi:hypothetical protein ABDK56_05300 [Sphingomonas sp. ASV193]|uniref:Sec-independent protein translocase subunit TatA/TatB n=1 Tax=Sphingomonas sp. ASV193 TaxID=3144405 RepID=UPI0032E8CF9B